MRRIITILTILIALTATAQTHYKPRISIGGRAGITMAEMSFNPSTKQSWNNGTTGAVTFRYTEENLFGVIAELGWVQRGWSENFEDAPLNYSRTLTYINLPILTHIYFGSRRFKCFFNLGPQVALYLGDSINANFDYRNPLANPHFPTNRQTEQLWADVTGKFDYGICIGFGGEYYIQPRHSIFLEARGYYGLGNIYPAAKADTFGASRNVSLEFTLGYYFRLR